MMQFQFGVRCVLLLRKQHHLFAYGFFGDGCHGFIHGHAIHIAGERAVIAFTAHAGEGNDGSVAVSGDGILNSFGILCGVEFGDGNLTAQSGILTAGAADSRSYCRPPAERWYCRTYRERC